MDGLRARTLTRYPDLPGEELDEYLKLYGL